GGLLELDAALREEPLRDPDVEREPVRDRQPVQVDRRQLPVVLVRISHRRTDEGEQQYSRPGERNDRRQPTNSRACHPMYLPDLGLRSTRTHGALQPDGAIMGPRLPKCQTLSRLVEQPQAAPARPARA